MKSGAFIINNYFLSIFLLIGFPDGIFSCDTKWIRFVYMMSCGKKKRESVPAHNETFYRNIPSDFEGALKYFKESDPFNPMLSNEAFLYQILQEDKKSFHLKSRVPKLIISEKTTQSPQDTEENTTPKKLSVLINRLIFKVKTKNNIEIPGFPAQWDIDEIFEEKINGNHRREIDRLIEECCKVPPVTTCNGNTFLGACK